MKFKVRPGFVVHLSRVVEIDNNGQIEKQVQTNSFFPNGDAFELSEADAFDHLHKLEPADKEATKWIESQFAPVDEPKPVGSVDPAALAQAVAATLQAMGLVVPAVQANQSQGG